MVSIFYLNLEFLQEKTCKRLEYYHLNTVTCGHNFLEGCSSGRWSPLGKRVNVKTFRGFESHPLRTLPLD